MSSKIDERIVGMKFNGDQFNKGVADTSSALDKLKKALNLDGAKKGLEDLDAAGKNFSLASLANGVEGIMQKFGALSIIGITALTNIANKAVDAGLQIMRSLTIAPITDGFAEYELKMGSIQTILANTARFGTQLPEVTANLDELNKYADKTIYNFGDMTKNIGLFTNAGIQIGDATSMIKGFSNEAAASGTTAQGAAGAAYQLSQALSAGTIRLMDWRSLQNVGMGNKNMQNGLIEIAEAMGMFNDETTTAQAASENFNGSLEANWLSADVMSNYLKIMAGDMDAAAMSALGLSDAQIQAFAKQQTMSEEAATKVRTYTQLLGTLQESVGSGWSETFDILIGDFNTATDMWTAVNDKLGGIIDGMADARNNLLREFVAGGGRDALLSSIANIWTALEKIIKPIKQAFENIFPPMTAAKLLEIVKAFERFTESLIPSVYQMSYLKRIFEGVFAVLDIGWMIIKGVVGVLARLFGVVGEGTDGFLQFSAKIGDWLVNVRDAIKEGTALTNFFQWLGDVLQWPIDKLKQLGSWTVNAVGTWDLAKAWEAVANAFQKIKEHLAPAWENMREWMGEAKDKIVEFFKTFDFNILVGLLNFGALAGIGLGLKKAFDFLKGKGIMGLIFGDSKESGPGFKDKLKEIIGAITDTFGELQNTLKSTTLIAIGIAIALITASVVALSFVDTGKLFIVLGAMTIMFAQLSSMLIAIDKLTKNVNAAKLIATGIALGILAAGMVLMSTAVLIMSTMDWDELVGGLIGLSVGLGAMVGAMALLNKMEGSLARGAASMLVLSGAVFVMSLAMKIFSTMSWDDILRAGTLLIGTIGAMVGAGYLAKKGESNMGSLIVMAGAMLLLSAALKVFASMSWDDILRSMVVLGSSMAIMVGSLMLLGLMKNIGSGVGVMILMAGAMVILSAALKAFGSMSWDEILRSLVVLAGSLAILSGAMMLMGLAPVLAGAFALTIVSAGMMMLAPALKLLGSMSWDSIGRGLTMLGASLAILAVGGVLLIPASVGFLLLGAALLMIGGAIMLAGQGLALFAAGFAGLVTLATLGAPAIKNAMITIAEAIPAMMAAFAQGIIDFALVIAGGAIQFTMAATTLIQAMVLGIANNGPLIIETITNLILQMLDAGMVLVPKFVEFGILVITEFMNAMRTLIPMLVTTGMDILIGVLNGIASRIGELITAGTNVIINFITGIGQNAYRVVTAAGETLLAFINGLTSWITNNTYRFISAGNQLVRAIVNGVSAAIENSGNLMRWAGERIGNAIIQGAKNALGINSPSKVFRDKIMGSVFEGIEDGNKKILPSTMKVGGTIGDALIEGTAKSLQNMESSIPLGIDFDPTIRPVLDLSDVKKNSALISGMLNPPTLKVDDSYAYASSIATTQREYEEARSEGDDGAPAGTVINFTQNNNSPKALTPAEIYRQTHNQLSVVKKGQPSYA